MASAAPGVRRMGACETTPQTSTQPGTASPCQPATRDLARSSLPIIGRRLPASSSFVLAAARMRALQLDPAPRGGRTGQLPGRTPDHGHPSPAPPLATGPDPHALLTPMTLMGVV